MASRWGRGAGRVGSGVLNEGNEYEYIAKYRQARHQIGLRIEASDSHADARTHKVRTARCGFSESFYRVNVTTV